MDTIALPVSPAVADGVLQIQSSPDLAERTTEASYDFATRVADGLSVTAARDEVQFTRPAPAQDNRIFYRVRFARGTD